MRLDLVKSNTYRKLNSKHETLTNVICQCVARLMTYRMWHKITTALCQTRTYTHSSTAAWWARDIHKYINARTYTYIIIKRVKWMYVAILSYTIPIRKNFLEGRDIIETMQTWGREVRFDEPASHADKILNCSMAVGVSFAISFEARLHRIYIESWRCQSDEHVVGCVNFLSSLYCESVSIITSMEMDAF